MLVRSRKGETNAKLFVEIQKDDDEYVSAPS
ncbi:MAG: hypothetical protein GFH27_549423n11 [Chloroflexi bacterium AL-W]|nr:hypothetical protein [Chloroflexi bacterium AL-N1]NOK71515.1 hypothetical protein [Chloroflexi bacterium AL-N10]NOK78861.1 hypothetical protein [Chloroflexi bacterium AL-N5]NOK86337.1 hypothetical protein [Chloroflexi bacterium AL-W]NOK93306.1 hypothetical protein [Chloroflexi bacterium AL-N15]